MLDIDVITPRFVVAAAAAAAVPVAFHCPLIASSCILQHTASPDVALAPLFCT